FNLAIGDLDGDGDMDIVTANQETLDGSVLLNQGAGVFSSTAFPIGYQAADLALGDLDGDGYLDAVTGNGAAQNVSVFLGQGDGTFGRRQQYAGGGGELGVGDVTGDGVLDVVTTTGFASLAVLTGNGDGT